MTTSTYALQHAGLPWTMKGNTNKILDEKLAIAFADVIDDILTDIVKREKEVAFIERAHSGEYHA